MLKSNFTSHPFKSLYFLLLFFILNMNYLRVFAISNARLLVHLSLASVFTTSNTSFVGDNMSSEYTTKTVFDVFAPFICWRTQNAQLKSRHFSGFLQHPIHYNEYIYCASNISSKQCNRKSLPSVINV